MRTKFFLYQVIFLMLTVGYSCKKDKATQPQDPILNISRTNIEVGNDVDYTDTVVIQSNMAWTISVSDDAKAWLSAEPVNKVAGDSSTVVTIKVKAVNTSSFQTATLTITPASSNMQSRQINITRKAYSLVWQKCYGGSDYDQCLATALLPNGQFVTTGHSLSTDGDALGNNGALAAGWAIRAGNDAGRLWQKQIGGLGASYQSIVASPDGGTVSVGYFSGANASTDWSIVKLDGNGNVVWNKTYGGSSTDNAYKIISTPDGGYLVAGHTVSKDGDVKTNHGRFDCWVLKLDADGNVVWNNTYGGAQNESYPAITASSDGGYVLLCSTESNNSGDVPANHGDVDFLAIKIDGNGNKIWSKTFGGSSQEASTAAIADTDGGCIVMGYTTSEDGDVVGRSAMSPNIWLLKLTKDGQIGWQTLLGGPGFEEGHSMARLPNGNLAIGGITFSNDHGYHGAGDVRVVVTNSVGKILWKKAFGSSAIDDNTCINAAPDGSILVTNSVTVSDGDVSGSHGGEDGWIFKLQ